MPGSGITAWPRGPTFEPLEARTLLSSTLHAVLLDTALQDYESLATSAVVCAPVITFNSQTDSLSDVIGRARLLAKHRGERLASLSVLSHGRSGGFFLGNEWVDAPSLASQREAWASLGEVMEEGANLYLFGCEVGAGDAGQQLVDRLSATTGLDVFASDDLTGMGGDWQLEVVSQGAGEELSDRLHLPMDAALLGGYAGTLAYADGVATTEFDVRLDFDEGAGTNAGDGSPFGTDNDGTLENGATWEAGGWLGGAVSLDGNNDFVEISNSNDINLGEHYKRTISAWFRVDDASISGRKQVIFEEGGGVRGLNIYVYDGRLYVGGWNIPGAPESGWAGTWLSTGAITSGQWHHVALVLDGPSDNSITANGFKGYLDGVQFGSGDASKLWAHSGRIGIGAVNNDTVFHDGNVASGHEFGGDVDEFRLYNRALSAAEIGLLANDPVTLDTNAGLTANEGASASITNAMLKVIDPDTPTTSLTYTITEATANGTLYRNAAALGVGAAFTQDDIDSGRISYTHAGSETVADAFKFTVADGGGFEIGETTFSITVNPVNDNPVLAANAGLTVDEGNSGGIDNTRLQVTDVDSPAAVLTYTITAATSNGTLYRNAAALGLGDTFTQHDINMGRISYTHDGSETISDSFTFTVSDGGGGSIGATVFNITVNPINDLPVLTTNNGATLNEGASTVIGSGQLQVTDGDHAAGAIIYTLTAATTNGTLYRNAVALGGGDTFTQADINAGIISYTHDGSETVADSFTFTVSDGAGGSIGATVFNITVNPVNDSPLLATNTGVTLDEGNTAGITAAMLQVTDADNLATSITYTIAGATANGTVYRNAAALGLGSTFTQDDIDNGRISYTHNGSETVADSFTFTVNDGAGGSIGATVFGITINPVNDAPALVINGGTSVPEGGNTTIHNGQLLVTDAEQGPANVTFTLTTLTINGALYRNGVALGLGDSFTQEDIDNSLFTYTHDGSETVADNFTFTVSDGAGGSIGATVFGITIAPVNDAPVLASNAGLTVDEGAGGTISTALLRVTDIEQGPADLVYTVTAATANGTLFRDGVALGVTDTFTQDDIDSNRITYTHDGGETTSDSFKFAVSDGDGGAIPVTTFSITVNPLNDAPSITNNAGAAASEGSNVTLTSGQLLVSDVDTPASSVVFTVTAATTRGTLYRNAVALGGGDTFTQADINAGIISYTHDGSETVADSFTFTVDDGAGGSIGATVFNITVNPVNDSPVVDQNSGVTVNEAGSVVVDNSMLRVTDAEQGAGALTFTITGATSNGTLCRNAVALGIGDTFTQADINAGIISYTHDGSETVADSFTFTVSDGAGGSLGATSFSITVNPVNDSPVLVTNGGAAVDEGAGAVITSGQLQVTDPDQPATSVVYTVTVATTNGVLCRNAVALGIGSTFTQDDIDNGRMTYTHSGSETVADSFTFTVSDGAGGSVGATVFNITVNPVNDAPVALSESYSIDPSTGPLVVGVMNGVLANDYDAEGQPLTILLVSTTARGTLTLSADGSFTYEPGSLLPGIDSFTYRLSDGVTFGAPVTVTIAIEDPSALPMVHDAEEAAADPFIWQTPALSEPAAIPFVTPPLEAILVDAAVEAVIMQGQDLVTDGFGFGAIQSAQATGGAADDRGGGESPEDGGGETGEEVERIDALNPDEAGATPVEREREAGVDRDVLESMPKLVEGVVGIEGVDGGGGVEPGRESGTNVQPCSLAGRFRAERKLSEPQAGTEADRSGASGKREGDESSGWSSVGRVGLTLGAAAVAGSVVSRRTRTPKL